ncbi:MAG TPA: universal stress protein [Longimicrobiales bacterium]|nr:universal stress protein [Longimicrobiales bacterium]
MMRTIMVPLDGSAFAEQALPLAMTLARRGRAHLHLTLVRAALPDPSAATAPEEYLAKTAAQIEAGVPEGVTHSVLSHEPDRLTYPPPPPASVADALVRYVSEHDVDLVLMTTHGRGGVGRAWLGSTADALVRAAPKPVLLVRPEDEEFTIAHDADHGINHVVIPLDGSDAAERAIPFAREMGSIFGARYTLVRVVSPLTYYDSPEWIGPDPAVQLTPLNREAAVRYLDGVANRLREDDMQVETALIEAVSAADAIIRYAEAHGADLIVLSSSGAGGIRRLLLGSVADKIVRSADVPVMVCNTRVADPSAGAHAAETSEHATQV